MVSTAHQSTCCSSLHWANNWFVSFQILSPLTIRLPAVILCLFLSYGKASHGTQTKTSSSATQRRAIKLWLRCLKVLISLTIDPKRWVWGQPHVFSAGTRQPLYWQKPVYDLDPSDPTNNGFINEDLIVWMREAAFPNFKKLYGILNRAGDPFTHGLPKGNYSIQISYSILFLQPRLVWRFINVFSQRFSLQNVKDKGTYAV